MDRFSEFHEEYRQTEFNNLRIIPLLSAAVFNRKSIDDRVLVHASKQDKNYSLLRKQATVLNELGFPNIGIWTSRDSRRKGEYQFDRVEMLAGRLVYSDSDR